MFVTVPALVVRLRIRQTNPDLWVPWAVLMGNLMLLAVIAAVSP